MRAWARASSSSRSLASRSLRSRRMRWCCPRACSFAWAFRVAVSVCSRATSSFCDKCSFFSTICAKEKCASLRVEGKSFHFLPRCCRCCSRYFSAVIRKHGSHRCLSGSA